MIFDILQNYLFIQFSSILILIFLGFLLRKYNFISQINLDFLNNFCIHIILPCFIISSFMTDLNPTDLQNGINIILWSIFIHIIFYFISYSIYKHQYISSNDRILLQNILSSGNISFFGMAVVALLYGSNGIFAATMYSIVNRIFINTICLISLSGKKITFKDILTILKIPSVHISLICSFLFFTQNISPQITINNTTVSIFRIDQIIPFLYYPLNMIGNSLNMFIWIIVGASITKESFQLSLKSSKAIQFTIFKIIIFPIIGIFLYICLNQFIGFTIAYNFLPATLLLLITPVANTLLIFSFKYNRSSDLCIACFIDSTIGFLLFFPLYHVFFKRLLLIL